MRRYYQILGVSPTASPQEIKEAWLFSLKAFHPDKFADASRHQQAIAEARTQAINEAYKVLIDPVSRSVYDRDYFREISYEKSSASSASTLASQGSSESRRSATAKSLVSGLWSSAHGRPGRLAMLVGLVIVAVIGLLFLWHGPPTNRPATASGPPFTQGLIPASAPTPTVVPILAEKTPAPQPRVSPPAVFDLPKLAAVARRAVGLVLGFDSRDHVVQTGSGFFISDNGEFVTNEHVIRGAKRIGVKTENGAHYVVKRTLASSAQLDLVVLQVEARDVPYLKLETSGIPEVGTRIAVIGSPLALEGTLSDGIISAIRIKEDGTWIQFTAPISPGSSGSPVLNSVGEVVGIVTLGSNGRIQNLNFARSAFDVFVLRQTISDASKITTSLRELVPREKNKSPADSAPPPTPTPSGASSPPALTLAQSPTPSPMLLPSPTPTPNAEPPTPPPSPNAERSTLQITYRVVGLPRSTPFLNIRVGPGSNFAVVGVFTPKGRGIIAGPGRITNGKTIWQEVLSGGIRGWVNAQYLEPEKAAETSNASSPARKVVEAGPTGFNEHVRLNPEQRSQYKFAEDAFKKQDYAAARIRFESLLASRTAKGVKHDDAVDLIKFKLCLTLLLEGDDDQAAKLMEQLQFTGNTPALYYAQAAWEFKHNNSPKANDWIISARKIYPAAWNLLFAESFYDLGWLKVTVPARP